MPYAPDLPLPTPADLDSSDHPELLPRGNCQYCGSQPDNAELQARWKCRYCGFQEVGPLTVAAEMRRCAAHEYRCKERPATAIPEFHEWVAYQTTHANGLRTYLADVTMMRDDRKHRLRRTWVFDIRNRRRLRNEISKLEGRIFGIYAHALELGLKDGWDDPDFRPALVAKWLG